MKDYSRGVLENAPRAPEPTVEDLLEFCLDSLFEDKKHSIHDAVTVNAEGLSTMSYEELLACLLEARKEIRQLREELERDYDT